MTDEKEYPFRLRVKAWERIVYGELAHMIAEAMNPNDHEGYGYGATRLQLDSELYEAVQARELIVRSPLTNGEHTFPFGNALKQAVVLPHELRPFLNARQIALEIEPEPNGPMYWTLRNAAKAIALQEGWHDEAQKTLLKQMMDAVQTGNLKVCHPHSELDFQPTVVRDFYELVSQSDVNKWLTSGGAAYSWRDLSDNQIDSLQPKPLQRTAAQDEAILAAIKKLGYEPKAMPSNKPGKAGVKADVRKSLASSPLFVGDTVFDKAWFRLSQAGDIVILS